MQATFWMAVQARDSVIAGDLATAKNAARSLEEHDYGNTLPASWKPWIGEMQKQAGEVVLAADINGAAMAIGTLGLTCGNCHYHHVAGPDTPRDAPVPWEDAPDSMGERMDRHYAGVEQLWMGLVDPSEEAWRAGTITLTRAPLSAPQTKDGAVDPKAAAEIERVRGLAKRARVASSHPERAQIYGELIAGCGNCHTVTPATVL